jgi:hypothetical protein
MYVTYITNGFSPSMLAKLPLDVEFSPIDVKEFCEEVVKGQHINAIGHQGTVDLINNLCGSNLKVNRISIQANVGDQMYIVMVTVRLEEGKVLSKEEITKMYEEGKVKFIRAMIYGAVLKELSDCEDVCDEIEYDALSYKAKNGD